MGFDLWTLGFSTLGILGFWDLEILKFGIFELLDFGTVGLLDVGILDFGTDGFWALDFLTTQEVEASVSPLLPFLSFLSFLFLFLHPLWEQKNMFC